MISIFLLISFQAFASDPLFDLQWSLNNLGAAQVVDLDPVRNYRVQGVSKQDINIKSLKNSVLSPRQVIVAVLDTGIDRNHPDLKKLHIVLHTSLSGVFNEAMVRKVGADDFLAKFHPDELAKRVNDRVLAITGESLLPP